MRADDPRHGSIAGYVAHRRAGDASACRACKSAMARYQATRELMAMRGEALTVPALGTVRRIRALVSLGWSMNEQSRRLGSEEPQALQNLSRKPPNSRIRIATARKIAALYDELCMTPGPNATSAQRARAKGWPPPLAWDDIDDPDEAPDVANLCADTACAGEAKLRGYCRRHYETARRHGAAA